MYVLAVHIQDFRLVTGFEDRITLEEQMVTELAKHSDLILATSIPVTPILQQIAPQPTAPAPTAPPPTPTNMPPVSTGCDPNYQGACVPIVGYDLNCDDIGVHNFARVGADPHDRDRDDA